jgi:fused signal recognition particle receptor
VENKMFRKITLLSVVLALIVIALGADLRLSGAAMACPDWPGCYGQFIIGNEADFRNRAALAFPGQPLDIGKAWVVMSHRYLMAVLGMIVILLGLLSWREKKFRLSAIMTTLGLWVLVGLQAFFSLWIVKLHAMPVFVTGAVVLEMMVFWLLFWLYLRSTPTNITIAARPGATGFARIAMGVLFLQIVLGAWVSANHAALACTGFPQCNGQWWPEADYKNALHLLKGLITGYTGFISFEAQVAVNWLHRVGALVSFIVLGALMVRAASHLLKSVRRASLWLSVLLFVEIGLGLIGVKLNMPLSIAVAHSVFAALLMLPVIAVNFYSRYGWAGASPVIEVARQPQAPEISKAFAPDIVEEIYVEPAPESLYLRLKSQLKRTRAGLNDIFANLSIGQKEINQDLLEEIETRLLMADIGVTVTAEIISRLTQSLERHQLKDGLALSSALKEELLRILKPCSKPLQIPEQDKPFVILVVGVNGAGKTTTIGKLAKRLQAQGHSVMLAAGDTFRAAAVEQLQTWGQRNNIQVVAQHTGADSASVIYDALQSAQARGIDVLIADTAGRLHTKSNLMDELKKVKRIMGKLDETAPHEVLLVLDAGTGQNALSQAKLFNEAVSLTGLVLTKLDGTAKGGVIFALAKHCGIPIRYIGIGEGIDDLQDFNAETFVDALFVKD